MKKDMVYWLVGIAVALIGLYWMYNNTSLGVSAASAGLGPGVVGAGGNSGGTLLNDALDALAGNSNALGIDD